MGRPVKLPPAPLALFCHLAILHARLQRLTASPERLSAVAAALGWPDDDAARLAALVSFGLPANVVYAKPAKVKQETGDVPDYPGTPGSVALRPCGGLEQRARSSAYHTWREVSDYCGRPIRLPSRVEAKR